MKEPAQGLASGKFPVNYGVIIPSAVLVFLGILESISRKPSLTLANRDFSNLRALRNQNGKWYTVFAGHSYIIICFPPVSLVSGGWKPSLCCVVGCFILPVSLAPC